MPYYMFPLPFYFYPFILLLLPLLYFVIEQKQTHDAIFKTRMYRCLAAFAVSASHPKNDMAL